VIDRNDYELTNAYLHHDFVVPGLRVGHLFHHQKVFIFIHRCFHFASLHKLRLSTFNLAVKIGLSGKRVTQQDDMKGEFPSTSGEAFKTSIDGDYYGNRVREAEQRDRMQENASFIE